MQVAPLSIPDVKRIIPARHGDARGCFSETFHAGRMAAIGIAGPFVQDNQSLSRLPHTLRGLHGQVAPRAQGKLVRCLRGAIWDVVVDARPGSISFGRHAITTLSAEDGAQLWIPPGFLHGFLTLQPETEVFYKVTAEYDPACERGVIWCDPDLAIAWPLRGLPVMSDKDRQLPGFATCRQQNWFG